MDTITVAFPVLDMLFLHTLLLKILRILFFQIIEYECIFIFYNLE